MSSFLNVMGKVAVAVLMSFVFIVIISLLFEVNEISQQTKTPTTHQSAIETDWDLSYVIDPETGCQYLKIRGNGTLTPRMSSDGNQICETGE